MILSGERLRWRRAFDWRVAQRMQNQHVSIQPFASVAEALAVRVLDVGRAEAGDAYVYAAAYRFPMRQSGGAPLHEARVLFDFSDRSYPYALPRVQVLSRPRPWSSHVEPVSGGVCIGSIWRDGAGRMLAGELVAHVMRTLNWDERDPVEQGLDPSARRYWLDVLGGQPLNPGLAYPAPPIDVVSGLASPTPVFRAARTSFRRTV